jgi:cytoskeletal protein CcmA (bactofilin family)
MSFFGTRRQIEATTETEQSPTLRPALPAQTSPIGFETVIGASCQIEGKFKSNSNVRIDGVLSGALEVAGNMLVGETAKIEADIHARNISIAGAVRGNVYGKKVQILRTGRVWGDIHATALTTEEGAFIDGKITMLGHSATNPAVPVTDPEPTQPEAEAPAEAAAPNPPDAPVSQE